MKKILFFLPRVLAILFIIFVSLFAFDMFNGQKPLSEMIIGFFIHLIPSFLLTVVLIIAWKNEKIGGVIFIILAFLSLLKPSPGYFLVDLIIFLFLFLVGTLLLLYWYFYKFHKTFSPKTNL